MDRTVGRARKARVVFEGALDHVMDRGDRREPIFRASADRHSRECGIETLAEALRQDRLAGSRLCPHAESFSSGGRDAPVPLCGIAGMKWFRPTPAGSIGGPELLPPSVLRSLQIAGGGWIAERLGMGTRGHLNHLLYRQRQSGEESP